jgi:hypothetical protein
MLMTIKVQGLLTGSAAPMTHQAEDVIAMSPHPRINVWNELGTGKTMTTAWWLQKWWLTGSIDTVVLVLPSMCMRDWQRTFEGVAWPDELVDFYDARPPDHELIADMLSAKSRPQSGKLTVLATTYGGARDLFAAKFGRSRWYPNTESKWLTGARGRGVAAVFDEAQNAVLPSSGQTVACQTLAAASRNVASVTATPIGNPLSMRLWGMTKLTRPDILMRQSPGEYNGSPVGERGSFEAFKFRYAVLRDSVHEQAQREGRPAAFVPARAYPVAVHSDMIKREILQPMSGFTLRRTKAECLDLPDKIRMVRAFDLPPKARQVLDSIVDDDRAVLENGSVIVPSNILEERLRVLELTGGWISGQLVHTAKLEMLKDVIEEIGDSLNDTTAPICIWASRSRELLAAACVASGMTPNDAADIAGKVYPPGSNESDRAIYSDIIKALSSKGVGVIHGPTSHKDRDAIQDNWKSGRLRIVVAHPGVAGAGLNWQHVKATVYYGQPLGTIARQQSEDRVHRHGLRHSALYYDLVVREGPDEAVAMAHAQQRDSELALLHWLVAYGRHDRV